MNGSPLLLLAVLGVLVALPLVLRRVRSASPENVRVLGRTALHKSAVVAVVAVGNRRLLVGAGDRGVQLLAELEPGAADDGRSMSGTFPGTDRDLPWPMDPTTTTTTTTTVPTATADGHLDSPALPTGRMDATGTVGASRRPGPLDGLERLRSLGATANEGPRTGLVDRLRAMTVRTPVQGRPFRVPLDR